MFVSVQFPWRQIDPTRAAIRDWVETAVAAGADCITLGDHILGVAAGQQKLGWDRGFPVAKGVQGSFTHRDNWHEAFVTLGFIAALCDLELATGVIVLPQRNTALVAKQAAQLDLLCNGKLRLGIGVGWNAAEFGSVGASFNDRGARFREQVELLRRFWTEEVVTFDGKFHSVLAAGIAPQSIQRPIPLWFGGANLTNGVEAVAPLLRRIGELADGWMLGGANRPGETSRAAIQFVRDAARACGRDPDAIGIEARLPLLQLGRAGFADSAREWTKLGVTHLTIDYCVGENLDHQPKNTAELRELVEIARGDRSH